MVTKSSFFEKLKKGMSIEESIEEKEKKPERKTKVKIKAKEIKIPIIPKKIEIETKPVEEPTKEKEKVDEVKASSSHLTNTHVKKEKDWFEPEGQLTVDVYQTKDELIIQSAVAGIKPEDLEILIEGDVITIKGRRENFSSLLSEGNYFIQECYWGAFSREIILPVEVDPNRVEATMKEGILTIRLPKISRERKRKISIKRG